jgi:AI-2 transport protein TqsA
VLIGVIIIGVAVVTLVGTSLSDFSSELPSYELRLQKETASLLDLLDRIGISIYKQKLLEAFNPGASMKLVTSLLTGLGGLLTNSFLILLTVIFILLEASSFPAKLHAILNYPRTSLEYFDKFINNVQRYMAIKTLVSLATGIAITIWLAIIGIDYPLLWGLLAFMFNYVPNIGSILAAVPALLLSLIQLGVGATLLTGLGYLVVNFVIGNVIEPRIMGRGLGLSTLVVFLSLLFWGWVLGPVGMLLSVPLTMTVKIALDSNEETRWIAILLGSEESAESISQNIPKVAAVQSSKTEQTSSPHDDAV